MITMNDIARSAGISRTTVSFVLNKRETGIRISNETRKKVLETAEKLGYRRNRLAIEMVSGKTKMIAFIVSDISKEYSSKLLQGASTEAENLDYNIKLFSYHDHKSFKVAVNSAIEQRAAGIIYRNSIPENNNFIRTEIAKTKIPVVIADAGRSLGFGMRIYSDDLLGAEMATNHLIKLGHKRIAHITWRSADGIYVRNRLSGFLKAMQANNLAVPEKFIFHGKSNSTIETYVTKLIKLNKDKRPTAIFCTTDVIAMYVLRVATKCNLKVPGDLSVMGYANLSYSALASTPLTTVEQPFNEMGSIAAKVLIEEIERKEKKSFTEEIKKVMPLKLIIRESTCPPKMTTAKNSSQKRTSKNNLITKRK